MATNAEHKSSTELQTVIDQAALIGIDDTGARHYTTSPVGETTIYVVESDGTVEEWTLAETPYGTVGGPNADEPGWMEHVANVRGWDRLAADIERERIQTLGGAD